MPLLVIVNLDRSWKSARLGSGRHDPVRPAGRPRPVARDRAEPANRWTVG